MNKEEVVTKLYQEIFHYAIDADYNISMKELKALAAQAGYDEQQLIQIIKDIYENLPVAYSFPQGDK